MASNVHPEDTVFIIVEPDFCFYAVDAAARVELLYSRHGAGRSGSYEEFAEEIKDPESKARFLAALKEWRFQSAANDTDLYPWPATARRAGAASSGSGCEESQQQFPAVPVFARPPKMTGNSTHFGKYSNLEDLLLYFNGAGRLGRGHLLWCGWNASQWSEGGAKTRNTCPTSGAQLVMLSTKGARFLCDRRAEIPDMHMGNFLNKWCGQKWQHEVGAAYIQPPIGSFVPHESTTTPGVMLNTHFNSKWAQEGTRIEKPGQQLRYICGSTV